MIKRDRYIIATFRKLWLWSDERKAALNGAERKMGTNKQRGYVCAKCEKVVKVSGVKGKPKQYVVDHIAPVIDSEKGFRGWDEYYKRMFCPVSNLQVLCLKCHEKKHNENKHKQ